MAIILLGFHLLFVVKVIHHLMTDVAVNIIAPDGVKVTRFAVMVFYRKRAVVIHYLIF